MSNNCNKCNKCKDECGCKRPNNPGPQIAIPLTSFVWTGDPIMCGGNIIVQPGTPLDQAFANLAGYACNLSLIPGPQGVQGPVGPQGPAGADGLTAEVILQNTLHVSKNGTALGERHNLGMPFNTIVNAAALAQPGDVIIVYPGSYTEVGDWVKSDVFYYFHPGASVVTTSHCINDNGLAKNILIFGHGKFRSNSGSGVVTTNILTNITLEGEEVFGNNDAFTLVNGTTFYIKVKKASLNTQYVATIRGNYQGIMDVENWEGLGSLSGVAVFVVSHAPVNNTVRRIVLRGQSMLSNSATGFGVITHSASGRGSIIIDEIKRIENVNPAGDSIYYADSGLIKSVNKTIVCAASCVIVNNSVLELKDVNIIAKRKLLITSDGTTIFKNVDITCDLTTVGVEISALGRVYFLSSTICSVGPAGAGSMMTISSVDAELYMGHSIFTILNLDGSPTLVSDAGSGPQSVRLLSDNHSNVDLDSMITNIVVGTNLVVDSNITILPSLIEG